MDSSGNKDDLVLSGIPAWAWDEVGEEAPYPPDFEDQWEYVDKEEVPGLDAEGNEIVLYDPGYWRSVAGTKVWHDAIQKRIPLGTLTGRAEEWKEDAQELPPEVRELFWLKKHEAVSMFLKAGRVDLHDVGDVEELLVELRRWATRARRHADNTRAERPTDNEDDPRRDPSPTEAVVEDAQVISDGRGNNEDEEVRLPPREDLVVQSDAARRGIFDIYDLLKADRGKIWLSKTAIFRAVADRRKGNKSAGVSVKSFMATEMGRLSTLMKRTLENSGPNRVRVRPKSDMASAGDDEQAANGIRDWILELGDGCQPEWKAREPFS